MVKTLLVFDVFITDNKLFPNIKLDTFYDSIRNKKTSYSFFKSYEIALYTLFSYSKLDFDEVLLLIEFEDIKKSNEFLCVASKLFKSIKIFNKRSSKPNDFKNLKKHIENLNCDFVFYAPNHDHPFISHDLNFYFKCIKYLSIYAKKYKKISLIYSHFQESLLSAKKNSWLYFRQNKDIKIISENNDFIFYSKDSGYSPGMQIVSNELFISWCILASEIDSNISIKRLDDLSRYKKLPQQFILQPKKELCRHFDSYLHTYFLFPRLCYQPISPSKIPHLFIPKNFFKKGIIIRYGYDDYKVGCVNVNPNADKYIFETKKSCKNEIFTDLKIQLDEIPFFWKDHIKYIEFNKDFKPDFIKIKKNKYDIQYPWKIRNFIFNSYINVVNYFYVDLYKITIFLISLLKKLISFKKIFFIFK